MKLDHLILILVFFTLIACQRDNEPDMSNQEGSACVPVLDLPDYNTTGVCVRGVDFVEDIQFITNDIGFAIANGEASFAKTINGGDLWSTPLKNTTQSFDFLNEQYGIVSTVFISPEALPLGAQSSLFKTRDGGATWDTIHLTLPTFNALHLVNEDIGFGWIENVPYPGYNLYKTVDGGETWNNLSVFAGQNLVPSTVILNEDLIYFGTLFGNIRYSDDGGASWSFLETTVGELIMDLQFLDKTTGFALFDSNSGKTTDGGQSWTYTALREEYYRRGHAMHFMDANNGFIITQKFEVDSDIPNCSGVEFLTTSDGGLTWTKVADQLDNCNWDISAISSEVLKVSNGKAIYTFEAK